MKKRTQYLWVLSRRREEKGLSMKAYSLSQLKSALTWLQPFEVRLAVILERLALASNNGNWKEGKKWFFFKTKGNASPPLSLFLELASNYFLIDFLEWNHIFFSFFFNMKLFHVYMKIYAWSPTKGLDWRDHRKKKKKIWQHSLSSFLKHFIPVVTENLATVLPYVKCPDFKWNHIVTLWIYTCKEWNTHSHAHRQLWT